MHWTAIGRHHNAMRNRQIHTVRLRRSRDPREARRISMTAPTEAPVPFRWDITRPERLGSLLEGEAEDPGARFFGLLLACAARVIVLAGDSDLVFLGRSPESLHDLLAGLLSETPWHNRLQLLPFSTGYTTTAVARRKQPEVVAAFRQYLESRQLSPAQLIVRERPVAIVDLICSGHTMNEFLLLLRDWATEEQADWRAVQRKLRVVGITRQADPEPTPRWHWKKRARPWLWRDHSSWVNELLERGAVREVAASPALWTYLGDRQPKTMPSYTPERWGRYEATQPDREERHLSALRLARRVFESGREPSARRQFAALLASDAPGAQHAWCRDLARAVRGG